MFEGFGFAIPALFVTFFTIGVGGIFVVIAAVMAAVDRSANSYRSKMPMSLFLLGAAVFLQAVTIFALDHIPYAMQDRYVLGTQLPRFVWSCFLGTSFASTLASALAAQWAEPVGRIVRIGSVALLIIFAIGFVWYLA
jgi:hypothetical protein